MVTTTNIKQPAREAGYEMMQYIAGRLTAVAGGTAVTARIGTLPQGAIIAGVLQRTTTAIGSAAAMGITLGQTAVFSDLASGLATTAGGNLVQALTTITQPLTADTEIWGQITSGATAGDAFISVWFEKPLA